MAARDTFASGTRWEAEQLWEALVPVLPGISIEVVEQTESTNTELLDRLRRTAEFADLRGPGRRAVDWQPLLLVAVHQTRGRGRGGSEWRSTSGRSLTFSLALSIDRADWSGLSLAAGVGLAEGLDPGGRRLGLKWPNDLWLVDAPAGLAGSAQASSGRKLGGILVETAQIGAARMAVIGVGLNVQRQAIGEFDVAPAFLEEIDAGASPSSALARLALPFAGALREFASSGFEPFAERFAARDCLSGRRVTTDDLRVPAGIAAGVDADGALLVDDAVGRHRVVSGSVRPATE